jgi:hypothetical protein
MLPVSTRTPLWHHVLQVDFCRSFLAARTNRHLRDPVERVVPGTGAADHALAVVDVDAFVAAEQGRLLRLAYSLTTSPVPG